MLSTTRGVLSYKLSFLVPWMFYPQFESNVDVMIRRESRLHRMHSIFELGTLAWILVFRAAHTVPISVHAQILRRVQEDNGTIYEYGST